MPRSPSTESTTSNRLCRGSHLRSTAPVSMLRPKPRAHPRNTPAAAADDASSRRLHLRPASSPSPARGYQRHLLATAGSTPADKLVRQARQEAALLSAAGVRCVSPVSEQLRLGGQMPPLRQIQQEGESMYNRVNDVTGTTGFSQVNVNPSGHVICPAKASCVAWHGAVCS
jgi:hypothetical protein